jgi:hypothetical protein
MSLQEAGQLPSSSPQHALSITDTALTSVQLAGKGIDNIYAAELLGLTARGLHLLDTTIVAVDDDAPAPSSEATGGSVSQHLLAAPAGYTFTPSTQEAAAALQTRMDAIAGELQSQASPAIGWVSASETQARLSVSVSQRLGSSFEAFTLAVGPQIDASSIPAAADAQRNDVNALVNPLAALKGPGNSQDIALQLGMVRDPSLFISQSPDTCDAMIEAYKAFVWNSSLTPVGPPLINLTLLTPAVAVKFPQAEGSVGDTLPCADSTGNATVDCRLLIDFPVINAAYVNHGRLLLCLRIVDGGLVAATSATSGWKFDNRTTNSVSLPCATSKPGTYVIAAVDQVDTTPPPQPSPSPAPAVANTTANATNATACNGSDVTCNTTASTAGADNATSNSNSTTPPTPPTPQRQHQEGTAVQPHPLIKALAPHPNPQTLRQGKVTVPTTASPPHQATQDPPPAAAPAAT